MTDGAPQGRLLGVDWGEKRIGVALSDASGSIAHPLTTLTRRRGKRFPMRELIALAAEHAVTGVVVGLPLEADGSDGAPARAARALAADIARLAARPVALWDERMSTARALQTVQELGGSTRGRKGDVDALAAAILLQHYLDAHR